MFKRFVPALFIAVAIALTGCGGTTATSTPVPASTATTAPVVQPTDTTAMAAPTDTVMVAPTATEAATVAPTVEATATDAPPAAPTATTASSSGNGSDTQTLILAAMQQAGLPIDDVTSYTAETDSNHLLGRPHQYIAKVDWHDTRLPAPSNPKDPAASDGGAIEIFANVDDANTRKAYIENLAKSIALAVEYDYVYGNVLLRLSKDLTPDQTKLYTDVFSALPQ